MSFFLADLYEKQTYSWEYLIDDINSNPSFSPLCIKESLYEYLKNIILAILAEENIYLIDYTFTNEEINKLLENEYHLINTKINVGINSIKNIEILINEIYTKKYWSITLFTSGTTGMPKKVIHNRNTLLKNIRISEKHNNDCWGLAYNITHIAGIQVFFQALFNGNSIVNIFNTNRETILEAIDKYAISHISATPTFYRLLKPYDGLAFPQVKRITLGGEKSDEKLISDLSKVFYNARILNTYATTEFGTLLVTDNGEIFRIKEEYRDKVKIENDELFVHKSLLGIVDIEIDEWYKTGDKVEIINNEPLTFKINGRESDFVNVGGYKVNLLEVEESIRKISGIKEVKAYSKKNSVLGNIVCADIVLFDTTITETHIRQELTKYLQEYKIPRIIRFVDNLNVTRTGKLKN